MGLFVSDICNMYTSDDTMTYRTGSYTSDDTIDIQNRLLYETNIIGFT